MSISNVNKRLRNEDYYSEIENQTAPQASRYYFNSTVPSRPLDQSVFFNAISQEPFFQTSLDDICKRQKFVKNEKKEEVAEFLLESEEEDECSLKKVSFEDLLETYKKTLSAQYDFKVQEFTDQHLKIINSPHYGDDESDFFQKRIDLALKTYQIARNEYDNIMNEAVTEDLLKKMTNPLAPNSFYSILADIYFFEEFFPAMFSSMDCQSCITLIENTVARHMPANTDIKTLIPRSINDLITEEYVINRSPKEFKGDKMIIDCRRSSESVDYTKSFQPREEFFYVDKCSGTEPDIQADIYSQIFWEEFNSDSFVDIQGQSVAILCSDSFFSAILRILKKEGTLTILYPEILDWLFDVSAVEKDEYFDYFSALGFSKIEILDNYPQLDKKIRLTK